MDENDKPLEELSETATPTPVTTLKKRFMGFALYHLCYSLLFFTCVALFASPFIADTVFSEDSSFYNSVIPLLAILSMALYFPLGMLKAKRGHWTVPTRREAYLAILQPCVISVLWAMLFPLSFEIFQLYFLLSALFAAPSSLFVISFLLLMPPSIFFAPLLAAVLPPLLFGLGSFWQAKRQNLSPKT